ncbi:general stress protein [Devosia sp.]|uniref:general stress protein n=1 Tax=Devosia sp. TaxID=1871048 RepID=UPI003BA9A621
MRTVTGLFDNRDDAHHAVSALKDAGIASDDISIVFNHPEDAEDDVAEGAGTGAGIGAAVGGAGGLLAGLGMLAIPGIGPVVAGGWLLSTVVGAAAGAAVGGATGGLIGALTSAGVEEHEAHVYAEGVRRGGTLVTARVDDSLVDAANAILKDSRSVDVSERRQSYQDSGWDGFDETAEPYRPGQVIGSRPGIVPPIIR